MREMRRRIATEACTDRRSRFAALLLTIAVIAGVATTPAWAATGYELDTSTPLRDLNGKVPHGIAVDQASQRIYVSIVTTNPNTGPPGEIDRFNSDLTSAGNIGVGGGYYTGVAVNPLTQGLYAAQAAIHTPFGTVGTGKMDLFSSSGTPGISFGLQDTATLPQIATDSAGRVYYPNAATHTVQVFNSAGTLLEQISCSGCPGGSFGKPASVAIDSEDDLYVADLAPDRLVKLTSSGGPYSFESVLQNGSGAAAVAVDPSTDDVFVGDMPGGKNYHIVAYDSSGTKFDDFGAGLFPDPTPEFGSTVAYQMAANATTHKLYVGEVDKFYVYDRVTSHPPTATITPATPIGQVTATLRANVNPKSHTVLECKFEYTADADFQINNFSNATTKPCSGTPNGSDETATAAQVSGLSPVTFYHYRVTAATFVGSVSSTGGTFETLPAVPSTVTTESSLAVTQSGATLRGKVNPHGGLVSNCHFEYGTSVSYGTNVFCPKTPEAVTTDVEESKVVSGLAPGTAYHYRLVVTTNAGTVKGADVEFTTAVPPPPPPAESPAGGSPPAGTTPVVTPPGPIGTTPPHPLHCRKGFQKKKVRGKLKCVKKKHAKRRRAHR